MYNILHPLHAWRYSGISSTAVRCLRQPAATVKVKGREEMSEAEELKRDSQGKEPTLDLGNIVEIANWLAGFVIGAAAGGVIGNAAYDYLKSWKRRLSSRVDQRKCLADPVKSSGWIPALDLACVASL